MKYSELDIKKLSDSDIYDLVMHGIVDYGEMEPTDATKCDFIIVLGCTPFTLEQRILKMVELYEKKYSNFIIISGGLGWQKIFKVDKTKRFKDDHQLRDYVYKMSKGLKRQKKALRKVFEKDFKPKPSDMSHGRLNPTRYYRRKRKTMKKLLEETESSLGYRMASNTEAKDIEDHILLETNSNTTLQNILNCREMINDMVNNGGLDPVTRIMVVTSPFHCRRARFNFEKHFEDTEIIACPSTLGIKNKGLTLSKDSLMSDPYYMKQFRNELDAIINYSRKGDIQDHEISDILGKKHAAELEERLNREQG